MNTKRQIFPWIAVLAVVGLAACMTALSALLAVVPAWFVTR
jgi:hypothetical protein